MNILKNLQAILKRNPKLYAISIDFNQHLRFHYITTNIKQQTQTTPDPLILDVGAGMGTLTNYSTNQNGLTINVEPTRKNKLKNQVIADGRYLPFKTQTFNITISSDVLEHIAEPDRNKFLIELLRCTKKSTIITFSKIHTCNPNRNAIKIFQAFTHLPPDWYNEHNNKNIVENQKVTDTVEQNQKNTVSVTPIVGFWAVIFTGILQNVP